MKPLHLPITAPLLVMLLLPLNTLSAQSETQSQIEFDTTPLEKVHINNLKIVDNNGQNTSQINVGQSVHVMSNVLNSNRMQSYVYIVQVQNEDKVEISLMWQTGLFEPRQSINLTQMWTPSTPGNYTVQIFMWQNMDDANALSASLSMSVKVT